MSRFPVQQGAGMVDIGPVNSIQSGLMTPAMLAQLNSASPVVVSWAQTTSWATIYAYITAAAAISQGVLVLLDDNNSGNFWSIPSGSYNLDNVIFQGMEAFGASLATINAESGMTITGKALVLRNVSWQCNGEIFRGANFDLSLWDKSSIAGNAITSPFYISAGGRGISITGNGFLQNGGVGAEVFMLEDTAVARVVFTGGGVIDLQSFGAVSGTPVVRYTIDDTVWVNVNACTNFLPTSAAHYGPINNSTTFNAVSGAISLTARDYMPYSSVRILPSGSISSISITAPTNATNGLGKRLVLYLKQKSDGVPTWPSAITNVKFPGGSFTKTTTANAVDKIDLHGADSFWWATVSSNL